MMTRNGSAPAAVVRLAPLVAALALACDKAPPQAAAADLTQAAPAAAKAASHVAAAHYALDTKVADCAAGAECAATVRLEALGGYHVNDNYPYKLTLAGADAGATADGVEPLGKDPQGRAIFSKASGDLDRQGEKAAVMNVRFKAPKGPVAFTARYKFAVCADATCEVEQADLRFEGEAK